MCSPFFMQNAKCKVQNFWSATLINNDTNRNSVGDTLAVSRKITEKPIMSNVPADYCKTDISDN